MPDWVKLIGGGFAHMSAPFGLHPYDKARAREYRDQVKAAGLDWAAVEGHFNAYANKQGWSESKRAEEVQRVRKYMGKHLTS